MSQVVVRLEDHTVLRTLSELRWHLDARFGRVEPQLVVDLSGLSHLTSPGVAALLWARRWCRCRGGDLLLRGTDGRHQLLAQTGLRDLFDGRDDRSLARARPQVRGASRSARAGRPLSRK